MLAVATALLGGRELRLARFTSESIGTQPAAIFITPEDGKWNLVHSGRLTSGKDDAAETRPINVFISWDNDWSMKRQERVTMLQATSTESSGPMAHVRQDSKNCYLQVHRWIGGVFDVRGRSMGSYLFALPGLMEEGNSKASAKRKRAVDSEQ